MLRFIIDRVYNSNYRAIIEYLLNGGGGGWEGLYLLYIARVAKEAVRAVGYIEWRGRTLVKQPAKCQRTFLI